MNSERYSRQNLIPEFGDDGQQKLEDASVLIIGATSIGSTMMYNLASAGVGTIGIADHNIVAPSNLNSSVLFEEDLGSLKANAAADKLKAYNSMINVIPHPIAINKDNVYEMVSQYDIIVLALNNPQIALLVNEACVNLGKPFVYGKTNGFVGTAVFILPSETPCLSCFYGKEIPPEENYGSISAVSSTISALLATSVIQYLLELPVALKGNLIIYHSDTAVLEKIPLTHREDCDVCGAESENDLFDDVDLDEEDA